MQQNISEAFNAHFSALAQELGPVHSATFLQNLTLLELPAGRKLIRHRMPVDSTYFIVDGTVEVSVEDGNSSTSLGLLGPGQWLGEVSALSGELMASATVTTQTSASFLRMRHEVLENLITNHDTLANVLLPYLVLMLSDRLRKSYQQEAALASAKA
jgi:CRP-like cAMP-binding protein